MNCRIAYDRDLSSVHVQYPAMAKGDRPSKAIAMGHAKRNFPLAARSLAAASDEGGN